MFLPKRFDSSPPCPALPSLSRGGGSSLRLRRAHTFLQTATLGVYEDQSIGEKKQSKHLLSPRRGEIAQDNGTKGGTFHGEMDRCRESQGWTTACSIVVCPNVTGRTTKESITQSKWARAGSLAIVDQPLVARACILRAFGLQMSCSLSLELRLFCVVSSLCFH